MRHIIIASIPDGGYLEFMNPAAAIFALSLMCGVCSAGHSFYVWQQQWTSNVIDAVVAEPQTTLYPIAAVVPNTGKSLQMQIPWDRLADTGHRFIPVIRIPLGAFNRPDIKNELLRIASQLDRFEEIQLDLDCPERRIGEYTELLQELRKGLPQKRLSITVLPCHLNNRAFKQLAEASDYYVLQVHGLEVPGTIREPAELMNLSVAKKAVAKAEAIAYPYSIALPCYAYELNFDPETGSFLFLTAEGPAERKKTEKRRIAARHSDLLWLLKTFQTLEHAQEVIWFRLPVGGDRLCLPRPSLENIIQGALPEERLMCKAIPISGSTIELILHNGNIIHRHEAVICLQWQDPRGQFDLYQEAECAGTIPGHLPKQIRAPLPPPGRPIKLGWFTATNSPTLTVKLK